MQVMNTLCRVLAAAVMSAALPPGACAAELPIQHVLTLAAAQRAAAGAQARAQAQGWPCVIAVVDAEGIPLLLIRMDNAAVPAGVELAPGKARTAALFRHPSGALEDAADERPALLSAGFVLMRGGLPIEVDGEIVGAIGVSADSPEHDEDIAKAGIAALH
jgi:glc operon protein GlcG